MSRESLEPEGAAFPSPTLLEPGDVQEITRLVGDKISRVEESFLDCLRSDVSVIDEAGRYIYDGGGKRVRPLLLLLSARLSGYQGDRDILYSVVFELIHTATLAHDDVIDNAAVRRGRKSLNSRWGNHLTVLLGDYLYIKSMSMALLGEDLGFLDLLADITLKMIEGEILQSRRRGCLDITEAEHLDIVRRKTAYLFAGCSRTGARIAGASPERASALEHYGMNLGMEFQLIDDLLDFTSEESVLGKPIGNDLKEGKLTLPLIYLLEMDSARGKTLIRRILESGTFADPDREEILDLVNRSGALDRARETASRYAGEARSALSLFEDSPTRTALRALPDFILARDH